MEEQGKVPRCPECGSPMVQRTAGQGRWAGRDFWGCSKYPKCKGIWNIEPDGTTTQPAPPVPREAIARPAPRSGEGGVDLDSRDQRWAIPREVGMRAAVAGNQVRVFQSNQQAERIVDAAYAAQASPEALALASQWRLEFPRPRPGVRLAQGERTLLGIVEKLLTRGTLSYTSPAVEDFIRAHSDLDAFRTGEVKAALRAVGVEPTWPYEPGVFDSNEERQFAEWFRSRGSQWSIVEQVSFASLLDGRGESGDERRVDFLLVSPGGNAFVVEVDGEQHAESRESDAARDGELRQSGIEVFRAPVGEAREGKGPNLAKLARELGSPARANPADAALTLPIRLGKLAHQVQVTLVEALLGGWLRVEGPWTISFGPPVPESVAPGLVGELAQVAAQDCAELVRRVCRLYGAEIDSFQVTVEPDADAPDIVLSFGDDALPGSPAPRFSVRDICFPGRIAAPRTNAMPMNAANPDREDVRYFLKYLFRKDDFLEGQWETIQRTLQGSDSIVLLPTGGGKSIAFQLSALLRPGCCVVIDPIISLIEDQIDNLGKVGIDRCLEISSAVIRQTRDMASERMGQYVFIYVAPERFQIKTFRNELRALTQSVPISEIAIDEAHCVSEWGHDFRTSYLRLGRNAREYCTSQGLVPPIVALTGTASRMVLKNIQLDLDIRDFQALVTPKSFDRPELEFCAIQARVGEADSALDGLLKALPGEWGLSDREFYRPAGVDTNSVIVFTSTIDTPTGTEAVAGRLRRRLPAKVGTYSGGAPKGMAGDWNPVKKATARDFKHDALPLLVATSAYGMGIDKPNVRGTVHFGLPHSIESFYQESGRAGRDKQRARCGIVFAVYPGSARLLDQTVSISEIVENLVETPRYQQDDLHQALYFHTLAFKGETEERRQFRQVSDRLGNIGKAGMAHFGWANETEANSIEKSLHRLSILGVVEDYEKDYSGRRFAVRLGEVSRGGIMDNLCAYVSDYQSALSAAMREDMEGQQDIPLPEFAARAGEMLIQFVYDHVEQAQRRALLEMLLAAQAAAASIDQNSEVLRGRVLRHLEWSEFDEALEIVVASADGGLDAIGAALAQTDTPTAADSLRGAVARRLESYPDQPGLLLLRGVAEALARNTDWEVVRGSFRAALASLISYRIGSQELVAGALAKCIIAASRAGEEAGLWIVDAIASQESLSVEMARLLMERIPEEVAPPLALFLAQHLVKSTRRISEAYRDKQQY